jgi:hypothetical protein
MDEIAVNEKSEILRDEVALNVVEIRKSTKIAMDTGEQNALIQYPFLF